MKKLRALHKYKKLIFSNIFSEKDKKLDITRSF
jgi:hypothetical protein